MKSLVVLPVLLALFATSCGGGSSTSLAGNWVFFVTSNKFVGGSARGTGVLVQSGNTVTGTLTFNAGCITTAQLNGTVSGNTFNFQLNETGRVAFFTGALTAKFLSASGSWTAPQGGCGAGDFGTWGANRQ